MLAGSTCQQRATSPEPQYPEYPNTHTMPDLHNFLLFAFASLMLNIAPGPDMLYVASRSAGQGVKAGVVSSLGIFVGCFVHILAAVFGISAILAQSAMAFNIVKWAGALYLIYIGIQAIRSKGGQFQVKSDGSVDTRRCLPFRGSVQD